MGYYGPYVEIEFNLADPDRYAKAERQTRQLIEDGTKIICEATFSTSGHYCMVDILRVRDDGSFDITEVKSSTEMKEIYLHDMAYQCWVVEQCGYTVASVSLMQINNTYIRQGALDLNSLFEVEDHTAKVREAMRHVPALAERMAHVADADIEPDIDLAFTAGLPTSAGFANGV